eukprot:CAMPEP_0197668328 /NCGR_PEP_ID=MMETSP1338-20131121/69021_1 /TAXON_ID=43686 ORGANISM="Pelagodinium beii, Strain RCC1491" /NCGR_SAMPLE_ID=MMETSP1338 /ASSEMBLY_ACC=CAM_ASM_000754 /LENGTH=246 /DNA_ID=CAMNT_0043247733 /DNA_START=36 /DNA_END=772 /DNA_ORIENTATION=-
MARRGQEGPGGSATSISPIVMDRNVICCVRLQTFLYFSCLFDLLFAFLEVLAGWAKYRWLKGWHVLALFWANYALCFLLEPARLYLGYAGNLGERVPELFLFVFMCLSCLLYLIVEMAMCQSLEALQPGNCSEAPQLPCIFNMEKACWIVRACLLFGELLLGVRALYRLIHEQSARFFVALDAAEGNDSFLLDDSFGQDPNISSNWATSEAGRSRQMETPPRGGRVAASPEASRLGQSSFIQSSTG